MEWTEEDRIGLQNFKKNIDYDGIKIKEQIKKTLLNNRYIIHVLNNKELEDADAEPDDYFWVNILPNYQITPTQTNVQNFICFTVDYDTLDRYNSVIKLLTVNFVILCDNKNLMDKDTGVARHDLLAALIQDQFNFTNLLGSKVMLVEDKESVVDTDYACRTLVFRQTTDNNIVKTRTVNGKRTPIISNKGLVYPSEME